MREDRIGFEEAVARIELRTGITNARSLLKEAISIHVPDDGMVGPYRTVPGGLNFYRDGHDSVAMHHDRTRHLVDGAPIAILSLGAPRDMLIRRQHKGARALRIALEPGSLLVMSHASQFTHEHGIPKTTRHADPRISCAFRARLPVNPI